MRALAQTTRKDNRHIGTFCWSMIYWSISPGLGQALSRRFNYRMYWSEVWECGPWRLANGFGWFSSVLSKHGQRFALLEFRADLQ
jgi:hypothetical protein